MTPSAIRRAIARTEANDLRRYPVRLWPLVTNAAQRHVDLCRIHGRWVPVAALEIDERTKVA